MESRGWTCGELIPKKASSSAGGRASRDAIATNTATSRSRRSVRSRSPASSFASRAEITAPTRCSIRDVLSRLSRIPTASLRDRWKPSTTISGIRIESICVSTPKLRSSCISLSLSDNCETRDRALLADASAASCARAIASKASCLDRRNAPSADTVEMAVSKNAFSRCGVHPEKSETPLPCATNVYPGLFRSGGMSMPRSESDSTGSVPGTKSARQVG